MPPSREGFWSFMYAGKFGQGVGMLTLDTGMVVGADCFGGHYDGSYEHDPRSGGFKMKVTITAGEDGVWFVQEGKPTPKGHGYYSEFVLFDQAEINRQTINTPIGPVELSFRKVRDFPPD